MQYIQKQNWITRKKLLVLLVLVSEMGTKIVEKKNKGFVDEPFKVAMIHLQYKFQYISQQD